MLFRFIRPQNAIVYKRGNIALNIFKYLVFFLTSKSIKHLHCTLISWWQKGWPDLRNVLVGVPCGAHHGAKVRIRRGKGLIIGGVGSCKLSSFVSSSSILCCLSGFLGFLRNQIHLTSPWGSPVDFAARERASLHKWSMINMIKYSHHRQWREDAALCPRHTLCAQ